MAEYIGSRISLLSNSDIRYVGVLHEVNSENSTVSLEQVRSYGTEGRRGNPADEIPASDTVYDYIVFRGSDVKDLAIEEQPAPPAKQAIPNDPAILQSSSGPGGAPAQYPQQQPPKGYMPPYYMQQQYMPYQQGPGGMPPYMNPMMPPPPQMPDGSYAMPPPPELPPVSEPAPVSRADAPAAPWSAVAPAVPAVHKPRAPQPAMPVAPAVPAVPAQPPRAADDESRGGRPAGNRRNAPKLNVPASDFDFAESNAKFNKDDIQKPDEAAPEDPDGDAFYNKSSSFFDNISCGTRERLEPRPEKPTGTGSRQEERKLNMETFGQASVDTGRYRGRGRGRGRGGYGRGGRGGGGFQRNYNNSGRFPQQQQQA
ncbi:Scd6-like Sm domain-containing protein [Dipodascopsis tothii]|uniref:Scd6-like Sm domain-containing protein n=1 Tax=Dipodascopsis tothii TaxID=44089 RepID=UPI0034CD5CEC